MSLYSCSHKSSNMVGGRGRSHCSPSVDWFGCFCRGRKTTQTNNTSGCLMFCRQNSLGWLFSPVPSAVFSCRLTLSHLPLPLASCKAGRTCSYHSHLSRCKGQRIPQCLETICPLLTPPPLWDVRPIPMGVTGVLRLPAPLLFKFPCQSSLMILTTWQHLPQSLNAPKWGYRELHVRNGMCHSIPFICLQWPRVCWLRGVKETFISPHPHKGSDGYLGY